MSTYNWKLIQKDHDSGLTWKDLEAKYNISPETISKASKAKKFKSRTKTEAFKLASLKHKPRKLYKSKKRYYDWKELQNVYDSGKSFSDLKRLYGVTQSSLLKAKARNEFSPRTAKQGAILRSKLFGGRSHSEETKKKLSKIQIAFLTKHPDKVPYKLNHSSQKSYPEKVFENALKAADIKGWKYHYQHGIYQYDFAFLKIKLDVEIDGGTHTTEKVKLIDKRRDEWSKNQGWKILRFTAKRVKSDVGSCINELRKFL